MSSDQLRALWWIPCVAALAATLWRGCAPAPGAAPAAVAGKRAPAAAALDRLAGRRTGEPVADSDEEVIPLLSRWHGRRSPGRVDTGRNLFANEPNPFETAEAERQSRIRSREERLRGVGADAGRALVRFAPDFACLLRYAGPCPTPPPPAPEPPRFPLDLIGVISVHGVKYAAFHDPGAAQSVLAKLDEKIGDSPFRVVKFNLTSVEVRAEGFERVEKLPLSTGAANGTP